MKEINNNSKIKEYNDAYIEGIKKSVYSLRFASNDIKNNQEVVLAAIQKNPSALRYASEEMKQKPCFKLITEDINSNVIIKEFEAQNEYVIKLSSPEAGFLEKPNYVYNGGDHFLSEEDRHLKLSVSYPKTTENNKNNTFVKFLTEKKAVSLYTLLPFLQAKDHIKVKSLCKDTNIKINFYSENFGRTALIDGKLYEGYYKFLTMQKPNQDKNGQINSSSQEKKILEVSYPDYSIYSENLEKEFLDNNFWKLEYTAILGGVKLQEEMEQYLEVGV